MFLSVKGGASLPELRTRRTSLFFTCSEASAWPMMGEACGRLMFRQWKKMISRISAGSRSIVEADGGDVVGLLAGASRRDRFAGGNDGKFEVRPIEGERSPS